MKSFDLKVTTRTANGKKDAKKQRKQGMVPCVMYGGPTGENKTFMAEQKNFIHLVYTANAYIVNLDIDGEKHRAIIKDLQFNPTTDRLSHVDFLEISDDKKIEMSLQLVITGQSIGEKNGGKLRVNLKRLKVLAYPSDMPDTINLDVSNLDVNDHILVKDLKYDKLEFTDPGTTLVATVLSSRALAKMEEEAAAALATPATAVTAAAPAEGQPAAATAGDAKQEPAKEKAAK